MQDGTPIIIKKKKVHGHGHHGGAWKVAYADFVTAMMAFFMVMWIMGLSQEDRNVIQSYFNDPQGFDKRPPRSAISIGPPGGPASKKTGEASTGTSETQKEVNEALKLQKQLEGEIQTDPTLSGLYRSDAIDVNVNAEGVVLEFIENEASGEIFFSVGSAQVRPAARLLIQKVAPILAATRRPMQIEGHTDARPYPGSGYDNFDLSTDRANAVRRLFLSSGISGKQIVQVTGYADTRPRTSNPLDPVNRRVSVLLPYAMTEPDIKSLPSDELNESVEGLFRLPQAPTPPQTGRESIPPQIKE